MRRKFIIIIIACFTLFSGCKKNQIQYNLKQMLGKEIKFPSNLQSLTNDGPLASRRDSNAILIYYYDGNECTSCNIANLNNIINIYQSPNLSIIPIFSINDDEHYLNLTTLLNNNSIKTIAYIDINKDFIRKNSFIPKDSKFHTFLLNKQNKIVYVGNPLASDKAWALFTEILEII
jgi:lipoprotein